MSVPALRFLGHKSYPFQIYPPSYSLAKQAEADIQKAASQLKLFKIVGLPCSHLLDFKDISFRHQATEVALRKNVPKKKLFFNTHLFLLSV